MSADEAGRKNRTLLLAGIALLAACEIDNTLAGQDKTSNQGEDTAEEDGEPPAPPDEPDIPELEGCYELFHSETIENSPDLYTYKGSHEGPFCAISTKTPDEDFFFDFNDFEITEFMIVGEDISVAPEPFIIRVVGRNRNPFDGSYPDWGNNYSNWLMVDTTPAFSGANWTITAVGDAEIGDMSGQECWPECDWSQVTVEIYDSATAAAGACDSEYGIKMHFCPTFGSPAAARQSRRTRCQPGSGRFRLVPIAALNRDHDNEVSYRMQPVLLEGTGQLTSTAWFSRIKLTYPLDQSVRVMGREAAGPFFDELDRFSATTFPHAIVDSGGIHLTEGAITGSTPFLVEHFPILAAPDFTFEADWACADDEFSDVATDDEPNYSFSIADLDCLADWPQRVSISPAPPGSGGRMRVELEGLPEGRTWISTTPGTQGDQFTIERRGMRVSGAVLTNPAGEPISVRLDEASYQGVPLCLPSTLPLERGQ